MNTNLPRSNTTRRNLTHFAGAAVVAVGVVTTLGSTADAALGYSVAYTSGDVVALRSAPTAAARLSPLVL
ncbi:MAG: hypothetical protein ACRDRU_29195 [Pseudonocardiaceae bacterium]